MKQHRTEIRRPTFIYRIRFRRLGTLRYLSHLDQIRLVRRIIRRAQLPVSYSAGFHPQPKISFGPAVSVGYASEAEYVDVELMRTLDYKEILKRIANSTVPSFTPEEINKVPPHMASLESYLNCGQYIVIIPPGIPGHGDRALVTDKLGKFLESNNLIVTKTRKGVRYEIDIRPLVKEISCPQENTIDFVLRFGPKKNIKPGSAVAAILGLSEHQMKLLHVTRKALYNETSEGALKKP